jgi:anti-sigma B factor antagonist
MVSAFFRPRPTEATAQDVTVVYFTGSRVSLDEVTLQHVREQLLAIVEESSHRSVIIDFGKVDFVSCAALGMLVVLHKKLLGAGRRLTIRNLHPQIYEVFAVTPLEKLLDLRLAEPGAAPAPVRYCFMTGDPQPLRRESSPEVGCGPAFPQTLRPGRGHRDP